MCVCVCVCACVYLFIPVILLWNRSDPLLVSVSGSNLLQLIKFFKIKVFCSLSIPTTPHACVSSSCVAPSSGPPPSGPFVLYIRSCSPSKPSNLMAGRDASAWKTGTAAGRQSASAVQSFLSFQFIQFIPTFR